MIDFPRNEQADRAVRFISNLTLSGDFRGQPFVLRDWQESIIRRLFGTLKEDGSRQYTECGIWLPRKNAKALALDTPLPTTSGWTTMGEVQPGEELFDEGGNPCRVLAVSDVFLGNACYRVRFSDGTSIIADAGHLWTTHTRKPEHSIGTYTTEEIKRTLRVSSRKDLNHRIPVAKALRTDDAKLPVDPYVLGAWLGDGNSHNSRITYSNSDRHIIDHCQELGYRVGVEARDARRPTTISVTLGVTRGVSSEDSLQVKLRDLNLLGNKHIPILYLRASYSQRLELLRGLMDTDGTCSKRGQCWISLTNEKLALGVIELVRSLGWKATVKEEIARVNGKSCGTVFRIQFWAFSDTPVFRLKRKAERQKDRPKNSPRSETLMITSVEEVPSVPVRCVYVDSPSHLYLAGRGLTPTHNTELAAAISCYELMTSRIESQIYTAAASREQASIIFKKVAGMIRENPLMSSRVKIIDSQKRIVHKNTGTILASVSRDAGPIHGLEPSMVIADEIHAWRSSELWTALTTGSGTRSDKLFLTITTAGVYDPTSFEWQMYEYACKVRDGLIDNPNYLPIIYAAEEDEDWLDEEVWHRVNPALGDFRSLEDMRQLAQKAIDMPSFENEFRQLYLNQHTAQKVRWIPIDKWLACGREEVVQGDKDSTVAAFDLSTKQDITALVVLSQSGDKTIATPYFWIPEETAHDKEKQDRTPYTAWQRAGVIRYTEGRRVHYGRIAKEIEEEIAPRHGFRDIVFDPWNAGGIEQQLEDAGFNVIEMNQNNYRQMNEGCRELDALLASGSFEHPNNECFNWMAGNVDLDRNKMGHVRPVKSSEINRCDGITALVMGLAYLLVKKNGDDGPSIYSEEGNMSW